jgi:hypothetical protein
MVSLCVFTAELSQICRSGRSQDEALSKEELLARRLCQVKQLKNLYEVNSVSRLQ